MPAPDDHPTFSESAQVGWEAALLEIEHQAEHWDAPDHGQAGHLIAEALRAAAEIACAGGLTSLGSQTAAYCAPGGACSKLVEVQPDRLQAGSVAKGGGNSSSGLAGIKLEGED